MRLITDIQASARALPAFMVQGYCWGAFAALVPQIKAGLGAGDGAFGLSLLCAAAGAVLAMTAAPWIDARAGRWGQALAAVALAAAFVFAGTAPALPVFAAMLFFVGSASGLLDVVMNARVSEAEARHDRSLMGLNHAAFSLAYAVSAAVTGLAREAGLGPLPVFCALLVLTLVLVPSMRVAPDRSAEEAAGGNGGRLGSLAILAGLITMAAFMTENAAEGWSALHIERTLGGGAAEGGLGPAVLGLTMAVGRLGGHLLTVRGQEATVIAWAAALSAAGAFAAAAAPAPWAAYLGFGVLGIGVSVIAPLAIGMAGAMARPEQRTRMVSRVVLIGFFGFFIGPPMMGFVSEALGLRTAFALIGAMLCGVPGLVWALKRRRPVF